MSLGGGSRSIRLPSTSLRIMASSSASPVDDTSCTRLTRPEPSAHNRICTCMIALRVLLLARNADSIWDCTIEAYQPQRLPPPPPPSGLPPGLPPRLKRSPGPTALTSSDSGPGGSLFLASLTGSSFGLSSGDRKSTRLNSSHTVISYAVFCLKKKKYTTRHTSVRVAKAEVESSNRSRLER